MHLIPASLPCAALSQGGSEGDIFLFSPCRGPRTLPSQVPAAPQGHWLCLWLPKTLQFCCVPRALALVGRTKSLGGEPSRTVRPHPPTASLAGDGCPREQSTRHHLAWSYLLPREGQGGHSEPTTRSVCDQPGQRRAVHRKCWPRRISLGAEELEGGLGRWGRGGGDQETARGQGGGWGQLSPC